MSLGSWIMEVRQSASPEEIKQWFYAAEAGILGLFVLGIWYLRRGSAQSSFASREADQLGKRSPGMDRKPDLLAHSRIEKKKPLALPGIRLDGPPHEILGVSANATVEEIQRAYREKMKQYHPDKIGNDGGKIAEAINRARELLLKNAQPKRSGR